MMYTLRNPSSGKRQLDLDVDRVQLVRHRICYICGWVGGGDFLNNTVKFRFS